MKTIRISQKEPSTSDTTERDNSQVRTTSKTEAHYRRKNCMKYARLFSLVILTVFWASAGAQTLPQFNIVKPSTTGVPGEEVRVMKFDPAGNLWAAGRFYFWGEAALGMLSTDQLDHHPLPGGGFDTGAWRVWSSVHHPIPSPYINDMAFGAGGVIWIASDGGLT